MIIAIIGTAMPNLRAEIDKAVSDTTDVATQHGISVTDLRDTITRLGDAFDGVYHSGVSVSEASMALRETLINLRRDDFCCIDYIDRWNALWEFARRSDRPARRLLAKKSGSSSKPRQKPGTYG